ncbi:MAG: DinB family protein [Candidatus Hatepunaea meridiana]|nr:DinB family protein [Candidatus Hatepunaea meridiana]
MKDNIWINAYKRGLQGTWSHPDPFKVLDGVDAELAGKRVEGSPYTIWQVMRHTIEWGWIMVKKMQGVSVQSADDENNFFPKEDAPPSEDAWTAHRMALWHLANETNKLLEDFDPDKTFPEWDNITAVDALMILTTHNAYHAGQVVLLRKMLGAWKEG